MILARCKRTAARRFAAGLLLSASMLLGADPACAADHSPREFFDERTGATVTVVHEPMILPVQRTIDNVNDRSFVALVAAEVDRSGHLQLYMIAYSWTQLDPRSNGDANAVTLFLSADEQTLQLTPLARLPADLTDRKHLLDPGSLFEPLVYPVTVATLQTLAAANRLTLHFGAAPTPTTPIALFESLGDGRKALSAFLERMSPMAITATP